MLYEDDSAAAAVADGDLVRIRNEFVVAAVAAAAAVVVMIR